MFENEGSGDPQSQAGTFEFLGREEGIEDILPDIAGNAAPAVVNGDTHSGAMFSADRSHTNDHR